jgi:hypothetical protein
MVMEREPATMETTHFFRRQRFLLPSHWDPLMCRVVVFRAGADDVGTDDFDVVSAAPVLCWQFRIVVVTLSHGFLIFSTQDRLQSRNRGITYFLAGETDGCAGGIPRRFREKYLSGLRPILGVY